MPKVVLTRPSVVGVPQVKTTATSINLVNGEFNVFGDSQKGIYFLRAVTTDATPTELFLDYPFNTQRLVLPDNASWTFKITITARTPLNSLPTASYAGFTQEGVIWRDVGPSQVFFQGSPSKSVLGRKTTPWVINTIADNVHGALGMIATGTVGQTIRWLAVVETAELND